jgi:hypothetical protein
LDCTTTAFLIQKKNYVRAGVTSFDVDLEKKKVVVIGDVTPYEVLASVSKVMKFAELWVAPSAKEQA